MEKVAASIEETCAATSLGRTKVFELVKDGTFDAFKVGRRTLVTVESIRRWADKAAVA